jgi:hypothetical protein
LPFLEQQSLYNQLDFTGDVATQFKTLGFGPKQIPGFRCPSDDYEPIREDLIHTNYAPSMGYQAMGPGVGGSCTQYPGNGFGTGEAGHGFFYHVSSIPARDRYDPTPSVISGVFARLYWAAGIREVTDGTSNVILMGEVLPKCGDHSRSISWTESNGIWTATTAPINFPTCADEAPGHDTGTVDCFHTNSWMTGMGFKSRHPGGANFVAVDASVHFLPEAIDYLTYQRLGDRSDGQVVDGWQQ